MAALSSVSFLRCVSRYSSSYLTSVSMRSLSSALKRILQVTCRQKTQMKKMRTMISMMGLTQEDTIREPRNKFMAALPQPKFMR